VEKMSKSLSLKLQDDIFQETEKIRKAIQLPRNAYINKALVFFNKMNTRRELKKRLHQESRMVSAESLAVLKEFESCMD